MRDYGKGRGRNARIAKAQRWQEWNKAIAEGRVAKLGDMFKSFLTAEAALAAVETAVSAGLDARIVTIPT